MGGWRSILGDQGILKHRLTAASAPILPPLNSSIPETTETRDSEEDWETYSSEASDCFPNCSRSCPYFTSYRASREATEEEEEEVEVEEAEEEVEEEGGWEDDLFCDAPPPLTRADIDTLPTMTLAREQVGL